MKNRHESDSCKSLTPATIPCMTSIARDSKNTVRRAFTSASMMQTNRSRQMSANVMKSYLPVGRRSRYL